MRPRVVVIDAYNIGHIAFHTMGQLDYHGRRTGVIYGFLLKVLQLAKTFRTNHFVFAWDSRNSLRKLMYPTYKERDYTKMVIRGTDEVMDYDALHEQMDQLYDVVLRRLGFANVLRYAGLEADDVIAAVVKNADVSVWCPTYEPDWAIASTDRDLYQLLTDNVFMYSVSSKRAFTKDDFIKRYDIKPRQWVEAKAMSGCDSDKIAGIEGIGDPAKSERSRALQIIRGELTKGGYVDTVNSDLGQYVIKRNTALIQLPMAPNLKIVIQPDTFDRARFLTLFDELGFNSFLKPEKWAEWEACFELQNVGGLAPVCTEDTKENQRFGV